MPPIELKKRCGVTSMAATGKKPRGVGMPSRVSRILYGLDERKKPYEQALVVSDIIGSVNAFGARPTKGMQLGGRDRKAANHPGSRTLVGIC